MTEAEHQELMTATIRRTRAVRGFGRRIRIIHLGQECASLWPGQTQVVRLLSSPAVLSARSGNMQSDEIHIDVSRAGTSEMWVGFEPSMSSTGAPARILFRTADDGAPGNEPDSKLLLRAIILSILIPLLAVIAAIVETGPLRVLLLSTLTVLLIGAIFTVRRLIGRERGSTV